jgi:hypothetical protein
MLVGIRYARSAFKHGITAGQIEYVVAHCGFVFDEEAPANSTIEDVRSLYLGDDANGVSIEVAGLKLESGELLAIHAMKLRARFRAQYERAILYRKHP